MKGTYGYVIIASLMVNLMYLSYRPFEFGLINCVKQILVIQDIKTMLEVILGEFDICPV